jgi:adenosylmethionine-8-amino-7-oxononanoate aminotransferase
VQTTGKIFEKALHGLDDLDMVGEVRGSHFMMGVEFVRNKETKEAFTPEDSVGLRIAKAIEKRGLIGRPLGNILILSPTLIMDEAMIMRIEGILREGISEVAAELGL